MKVYVAGPMTGRAEWNFPAFEDAVKRLREAGFEVSSPHEFDLDEGFDPDGTGEGFDLRAALERDVEEVLSSDAVALLDGWEESPGAVIEVLTASSKGAPSLPVADLIRRFGGAVLAVALILGLAHFVDERPRRRMDAPTASIDRAVDDAGADVVAAIDDVVAEDAALLTAV